VFNLALWSLETGLTLVLFAALPLAHQATNPLGWLALLPIVAVVSVVSSRLSAIVISLAEGRFTRGQWLHNGTFAVVGALASASLGLECVAAINRDASEVLLLMLPIAALS